MAADFAQFIRFKQRSGAYTAWAAQNFFIGQTVNYGGVNYEFRPVAAAITSSTSGGARSESAIGAPADALAIGAFVEAHDNDYLVEIKVVKVNQADLSLGQLLQTELWACRAVQYDESDPVVKLQLGSPLDAVRSIGSRRLSQSLVGALPSSGTLLLQ